MKDISSQKQTSMSFGLSHIPPRGFLFQEARLKAIPLEVIKNLQKNYQETKWFGIKIIVYQCLFTVFREKW